MTSRPIRRRLAAAAAVAATVGFFVAPASAAAQRTVVRDYTGALGFAGPNGTVQCCSLGLIVGDSEHEYGAAWASVRHGERHVDIDVSDDSGRITLLIVEQYVGDRRVLVGTVCGHTTKPLTLARGGGALGVYPAYGVCGSAPSVPTTGTVTFSFAH